MSGGQITHHVGQAGFGVEEPTRGEVRGIIFAAEDIICKSPNRIGFDTEHLFVDEAQIYGRSMFLPKNTWNTGMIHVHDDLLIIARGKVTFRTEHGQRTFDATERPIMTTVKGRTKPLVFAHEDTWLFSAHTNLNGNTTPEEMASELVIPNEEGKIPEVLQ